MKNTNLGYISFTVLYDLLDTSRCDFLAAQLHLSDSTLPRPLLHRSRGPPTLRNDCVALPPHLASPIPPDHLYVCHATRLSFTTSVCHVTSLSIIPPAPSVWPSTRPHNAQSVCHPDTSVCHKTCQSVCLSTNQSVALSDCTMASPFIITICMSYAQSIQQSVTLPVSPVTCPSDCPSPSNHLHTILPRPSGCPTSSDCPSTVSTSPSAHPSLPDSLYDEPTSPSACPSPSDSLTATMTHPTICPSSHMIHHTQDSSQSLAVVNWSNPASQRNFIGPLLATTYLYMP